MSKGNGHKIKAIGTVIACAVFHLWLTVSSSTVRDVLRNVMPETQKYSHLFLEVNLEYIVERENPRIVAMNIFRN